MMKKQEVCRAAASGPGHTETRLSSERYHRRARERGQSAVEFALIAPVALMVLTAIMVLGLVFDQYVALTFATDAGTQLLSISRGQTTDPCQTASQAVYAAAPQLTRANLKFTIVLGGTTVASNQTQPTCSGTQSNLVEAQNAQLTASYPCNLNIFGVNPAPSCTLTAQTTLMIQ